MARGVGAPPRLPGLLITEARPQGKPSAPAAKPYTISTPFHNYRLVSNRGARFRADDFQLAADIGFFSLLCGQDPDCRRPGAVPGRVEFPQRPRRPQDLARRFTVVSRRPHSNHSAVSGSTRLARRAGTARAARATSTGNPAPAANVSGRWLSLRTKWKWCASGPALPRARARGRRAE